MGACECFTLEHLSTPVGTMLLVSDARARVRAIDWCDYEPRMLRLLRLHYGDGAVQLRAARTAAAVRARIERYFAGELGAIDSIATETGGTAFQREVWAALRAIPAGETLSYGRLATQIGRPRAIRAVVLANGSNPIGVVVPCHRVLGADRSLTGYGGGLERKRWLLAHEGVQLPASRLAAGIADAVSVSEPRRDASCRNRRCPGSRRPPSGPPA
jgi:methylated-DNA-[protein]-cysteine S-methyltransferase